METEKIYAPDELIPSEPVHWDIPNIALYSLSMIILIHFSNPSCIKAGYYVFSSMLLPFSSFLYTIQFHHATLTQQKIIRTRNT